MKPSALRLLLIALLGTLSTIATVTRAGPADRFANVEVTAEPVSGPVYMLTGAGGNVIGFVRNLETGTGFINEARWIQILLTDFQ